MSSTVDVAFAFDTHKFVKQMIATGFTEEQAEAQVRLLSEILHTQLSTKADVAKVDFHVLELKRDIAAIEAKVETTKAELRKEIETAKVETIKWVVVTGIAILGGVATINRFAPPVHTMNQNPHTLTISEQRYDGGR